MIAIKRILFPTDFSSFAEHALGYAIAMAQEFDAVLYMLYVEEILPYVPGDPERKFPDPETVAQRAQEAMTSAVGSEAASKTDIKRFVARGIPADEIVEFAKSNEIDLIVMATHGRTGLKHALLGSTTEKVVRKAPCPVLSIHHPEHEFVMP
jgi:nucleotide-binding universal stress UspA family protein